MKKNCIEQMSLIEVFGQDIIPEEVPEEIPVEDNGLEHIKAKFIFCRYQDPVSGYCVCDYKLTDNESATRFTCTGNYLPNNKNLTYILKGTWQEHKTYGLQFVMQSYEEYIAPNKASIVEYLSSGVIKGIRTKTAEKIYAAFGNNTIKILDREPEKLLTIKGISKTKVEQIIESYKQSRGAKDIIAYLVPFGITTNMIMKIYGIYKSQSLLIAKEDPYKFCSIKGFSFTMADMLAKKANLPMNSYSRFKAGVRHMYSDNEAGGSLGVSMKDFGQRMYNLLNNPSVTYDTINTMTMQMINENLLAVIKMDFGEGVSRYIFPRHVMEMEKKCATDICRISNGTPNTVKNIDKKIEEEADALHITLDSIQKDAVKKAFESPLTVITGGPGTGKTTIIKAIAEIFHKEVKKEMLFSAPTGRAARRIKESCGYEASTIHKLTKYSTEIHTYDDEEVEIENSLVVIDEFSMTDAYVAAHLFSCIKQGNTVVIVGDVDQLPSVGPGCVLRDLIESGTIPVTRLENIYRQDENAEIAQNAKKMKNGDIDIKEGSDFKMFEIRDMQKLEDIMVERFLHNASIYGVENVMCLSPYRKHTAGINALNSRIQAAINPFFSGKNEITFGKETFREGDIVMHLVNDEYASNGDTGVIVTVNPSDYSMVVHINGTDVKYEKDDMDKLTLAYAMTYHKSQGSEEDCVIMCLTSFHKKMGYRNLPYTGATRGKKMVEFLGEKEALQNAIRNTAPTKRISSLCLYLKVLKGQFVAA